MYKAAEILEERLQRQEDAISRFNQCLQLQPGYLPAQKALTRLYERQGRFAELVAMYEQDLLQTTDRDQLITTLNKMAVLYEDRLNDLDHAIECMKRILDLASDHLPSIRNLSRLYERAAPLPRAHPEPGAGGLARGRHQAGALALPPQRGDSGREPEGPRGCDWSL